MAHIDMKNQHMILNKGDNQQHVQINIFDHHKASYNKVTKKITKIKANSKNKRRYLSRMGEGDHR